MNISNPVVVVVAYELDPTEVVAVVEGEKAVASLTGVKPKKDSEDMGSPGLTNIVEGTKRNPTEEKEIIKITGVKMVLTGEIEEMIEMPIGQVHGEDPTRTSIMQRRAKDKVTFQLLLPHPSNQLMQGTMVEITGAVLEPTNIGIMVTTATYTMMMGTSRNRVTITNLGMSTIALAMTSTPGNLTNARLTKEARGKVRIKQLARSRRRLKSKLNLKSKLYKFLVDNPKYTKYLMN